MNKINSGSGKKEKHSDVSNPKQNRRVSERAIRKELYQNRKKRTFIDEQELLEEQESMSGDLAGMSVKDRLEYIRNSSGKEKQKKEEPDVDVRKKENDVYIESPLPTTLAIDLIPIEKIVNGTIYTEDGRYIKIVEIMPTNFLLKSDEEQESVIYEFEKFLRVAPENMQLKTLSKRTDLSRYMKKIDEDIENETDERCKRMLNDGKKLLSTIGANQSVSRRFFLIFTLSKSESRMSSEEEIENSLNIIKERVMNYIRHCGNTVLEMKNNTEETAKILFDILNRTSNSSTDFADRVSEVFGYYDSTYGERATKLIPVKEYFSPRRINFKNKDYIKIDDTYYAFLYVKSNGFPIEVYKGWFSLFVNAGEGVDVDLYIQKQNRNKYIERIGRNLRWKAAKIKNVSDSTSEYDDISSALASGYYLKNGLTANANDFYYVAVLITITADNLRTLKWKKDNMITYLKTSEIYVGNLDHEQLRAFTSYLPLCKLDNKILKRAKRNLLTQDLAAWYPFTSYEMSDEDGILLGVNEMNNSLCLADFFNTSNYKNANIAIMGVTGAGKTYLLQLIAMRLRKKQIQTFIITPDKGHEFQRACANIGGEYISLSPGGTQCINIMEIRKRDNDANRLLDGNTITQSELALKIQSLHIFFKLLIPSITDEEDQILDEALIQTYRNKGITHDNESLCRPDGSGLYKEMPILGELATELAKRPEATRLNLMLNRFVNGSVAFLNQQTNVNLDNLYTVIDITNLTGELKAAGVFLALDFVYGKAKENRTKKKSIIIDEIWELIGSKSDKAAAEYALEIFKIIRGYGGQAICATQDLNDFFALEDGKYGRGIINNCKTKIVLNLEVEEATRVKNLLKLSDEEFKKIIHFEKGHGLVSTNGNNIPIHFKSSELENALITTDRAELEKLVKYGMVS